MRVRGTASLRKVKEQPRVCRSVCWRAYVDEPRHESVHGSWKMRLCLQGGFMVSHLLATEVVAG